MTSITGRLKSGLYTATQSMSMIWQQKALLIYMGIPAAINIIIRLILHNAQTPLTPFHLTSLLAQLFAALPQWAHKIGLFLLFMVTAMITTYFTVALIYRVALRMQDIVINFRQSMAACIDKLGIIALWAFPLALIEFVINSLLEASLKNTIAISVKWSILFLLCFWLLYTFFVLPIIALKQMPFFATLKLSGTITRHSLVEIIGGECWFILTICLVAVPFLAIELATKNMAFNPALVFLGLFVSEFALKCWLTTAHALFKTMLYQAYRKDFPDPDLM